MKYLNFNNLKFQFRFAIITLIMGFSGFTVQAQSANIFEIIDNSDDHLILSAAITSAGLQPTVEALVGTVFAPTDAAFGASGVDLNSLSTQELVDVISYHVLTSPVASSAISEGQSQTASFEGTDLTLQKSGNVVYVNNQLVSTPDLTATNGGIVHSIDGLLLTSSATVVDVIVNSAVHTTLATQVTNAGLVPTLQGTGEFTVFAPTDAAFTALGNALSGLTQAEITEILKYHVLSGDVRAGDLSNGLQAPTLEANATNITIQLDGNMAYVNNVMISTTDIVAGNGVVHVIDAVLLPSTATVVDIIANSSVHTTLAGAVGTAGLVDALKGPGEFTVFAPTDAAFTALGVDLGSLSQSDLADILKYHVLSGDVRAGDLSDGLQVATLEGNIVEITLSSPDAFVNGKKISITNLVAGNGVVHVIDAVLLPAEAPLAFNTIANNDQVAVYPNPAKGTLMVETDEYVSSVVLFDMSGNVIKTYESIDGPLDITDVEQGTYLLQIISNDKGLMKKVVVQ